MTTVDPSIELSTYCRNVAERAKIASRQMVKLSTSTKNRWLVDAADRIVQHTDRILQANAQDLLRADDFGLTQAEKDRLQLNGQRIADIARGLRDVAALPDPVGEVIEGSTRPNGLELRKVRVPLGVIFFIYESRPNVTADAAAIAIKSGNAIILRGGKEAFHSSHCIVQLLQESAIDTGVPLDAVQLVSTLERDAVGHFLQLHSSIDLAIPRGGEGLIRRVVAEATMPVLKHYDGNCHVYVDEFADTEMALRIIENAKCQRMGVCNAMESLLVHHSLAKTFLPKLEEQLTPFAIEYRTDAEAGRYLRNSKAAEESDWSQEYLGPMMSVRVVRDIDQAIEHINRYGSKHTDAIVTSRLDRAHQFTLEVDSAAVVVNASTRFNDGGQLGMGAEIGISTDKFHARGPCGLRELTTYKYIVHGNGQIRT